MFNFTQLSFILQSSVFFNSRGHSTWHYYHQWHNLLNFVSKVVRSLVFSVVPNWVLINKNFSPSLPFSHNLNNPDILIQELSNRLLNLHETYPGRFNILSVEFFLTFNYFPNF